MEDRALVILLHPFQAPVEALLKKFQIFLLLAICGFCEAHVWRLH